MQPLNTIAYHTNGQAVVDNAGNTQPIYGVQVGELMRYDWSGLDSTTNLKVLYGQNFIQAMHDTWHANTLRLQLTNDNLCAPGTTTYGSGPNYKGYCVQGVHQPNTNYISEIKQIVAWAEAADMNVIITQQYETDTRIMPAIPYSSTVWTKMATV